VEKNRSIGILGAGWLGLPLAKRLKQRLWHVKASTTTAGKLEELAAAGLEPFLLRISSEGISGKIQHFLRDLDVLIIDIPPGLRKDPTADFSGSIGLLADAIEASGVKRVLFISSISVYEETPEFRIYTEDSPPNAGSRAGRELFSAEEILLQSQFFETTILRFGGLIGAGRHPVKFLSGRKNLANPLGPVNLIHQKDCIGVILKILEKDLFGTVFNAVYPVYPPREKYYTEKAREAGLELPEFDAQSPSTGKIISASKLMRELDYEFQEHI
jgi:nucleoside-diphosphate-sugar epimerase